MVSNIKLFNFMEDVKIPEILTLSQACKTLNCHANTLRNWEKEGIVKCIRFGKRRDRRFRKEEILKLMNENIFSELLKNKKF